MCEAFRYRGVGLKGRGLGFRVQGNPTKVSSGIYGVSEFGSSNEGTQGLGLRFWGFWKLN